MTMSFYIGKDFRIYEAIYKRISELLIPEMKRKRIAVTKAAIFRFLLDTLDSIIDGNDELLAEDIRKAILFLNSKKEGSE